jgi:cation diffusion facilitator CzcD-associated flavoprotein CzcO
VPKGNDPYTAEQLAAFKADPDSVLRSREEIYKTWNTLCTFNDREVLAGIERAGMERLAEVKDPETRRKLTPHHPFGCRRPLFSDVYFPVFNRDNVDLITEDIEAITETGIRTVDGQTREVDVIVYSTGFKTTKYLAALKVNGRNGQSLDEAWSDGAQAYLGITTSGFPNLFMLYGPNTNQGCILYMIEQQVGYIVRQVERANAERLAWIDVKADVMAAFNVRIQEEIRGVEVWQAECGNDYYYKSASGRFVTQWPNSMDAFRHATTQSDSAAYESAALA